MNLESITALDGVKPDMHFSEKTDLSLQSSSDTLKNSLAQSLQLTRDTSAHHIATTQENNKYLQSLHEQKQADFNRKYGKKYRRELNQQAQLVGVSIPDLIAQFKPGSDLMRTNIFNVKYQSEALQTQIHHITDLISKSKTVIDKLASNG
jgi:hypothetical protein